MLEELEGLRPCFNGAAALAGVVRLVRRGEFPRGDTVLVNLTGSDRPPAPASPDLHWLARTGDGWGPADPRDVATAACWEDPLSAVSPPGPR
ncbi:MAG TPA: hypothetical protein VFC42_07350, partial [Methylomirabilota bacterium]|nr:hypothetical protein [Methylomirabilota bacterium]